MTVNLRPADVRVMELLAESFDGNYKAQRQVQHEAITTSDFQLAFQQVNNYFIAKELQLVEPQWIKVAKRVVVDNLKATREIRLSPDSSKLPSLPGGQLRVPGTLPVVPEETLYPEIGFTQSASEFFTGKNGASVNFTWEAFKNGDWGQIQEFPKQLAQLSANGREVAVWRQFYTTTGFNGTVNAAGSAFASAANNLAGNAALTYLSLGAALAQAKTMPPLLDGTPVMQSVSKWALLVSPGLEVQARQILAATAVKVTMGGTEMLVNNTYSSDVEVVVVPWVSILSPSGAYNNTGWALVPYGGEGVYGSTVINAFLRGEENPELRINNNTGSALGGGGLDQYAGSFDNDTIQIRIRDFYRGNLLNGYGMVWSKGTGVASNNPAV